MAKKNSDIIPYNVSNEEIQVLQDGYINDLYVNPEYSLDVDPTNRYKFSDSQKDFIRAYLEFKNIPTACKICEIDTQTGMMYYNSWSVKQEIKRINRARYHHQFATRLLNIDEIGGYLTSLIMDENVAEVDKLSTKDKTQVAKMLIDINNLKREALANPTIECEIINVEEELKDLSVSSIQKLLEESNSPERTRDKEAIIAKIKGDNNMSQDEIEIMKSMSIDELLQILEEAK